MPERRKKKLFYRVMLVEDDPDIRTMVKVVLNKSWAFQVVWEAEDGQEAVELLQRHQPQSKVDVILLDLLMPRLSGKEAFPLLKALVPSAKIVILTVIPERCDEIPGHDGCVDKSLLPSDMVFALYRCLNPDSTLTKEEVNALQ